MTDQALRDLVENLAVSITRLEKSQAKTDAQLAKTDAQLAKTIKKLDDIGVLFGELGLVQGEIAEEAIYRAIPTELEKRGKKFDTIRRNVKIVRNKKIFAEYDVIVVNGTEVLPIEVKNKLTQKHIDKFLSEQLPKFKDALPEYKTYNVLGGIGGLVVKDEVEKYAEKKGLFVFVQSKDGNMQILNNENFQPKVFA